MHRLIALLLVLFSAPFIVRSSPTEMVAMEAQPVEIEVTPVALNPHDPAQTRIGPFDYLGGWELVSYAPAFGGFSSLRATGNRIELLTDGGGLLDFSINRFGHIYGASMAPLPAVCGRMTDKYARDSEALARAADGTRWVGLEYYNTLCRIDPDGHATLAKPPEMKRWDPLYGPETVLRLASGRFIVIAERDPDGSDARPMLVYDGDPVGGHAAPRLYRYRPPQGFSPTDATQLPDGRLLVLNRAFGVPSLFTANITIIDLAKPAPGGVYSGPVLASFAAPVIADNMEGIDAVQQDGRTIVWIVSDNNFASWQRSLLLKFALDASKLPAR